jgi:hypothetical protein
MGFWKKIGEAFTSLKTPSGEIFANVNPDTPHAGLDRFSLENVYPVSIKITGVSLGESGAFCGRVIDWDGLTVKERQLIKSGKLTVNRDQFQRFLK